MLNRRFRFAGLFLVLLALMAQLGAGASVPRIDPMATAGVLCHTGDDADGVPPQAPEHPGDCPICPLCVALHGQPMVLLSAGPVVPAPSAPVVARVELPPPSTAPPSAQRPRGQPRAPPTFS